MNNQAKTTRRKKKDEDDREYTTIADFAAFVTLHYGKVTSPRCVRGTIKGVRLPEAVNGIKYEHLRWSLTETLLDSRDPYGINPAMPHEIVEENSTVGFYWNDRDATRAVFDLLLRCLDMLAWEGELWASYRQYVLNRRPCDFVGRVRWIEIDGVPLFAFKN